jgi:hypothetical protein
LLEAGVKKLTQILQVPYQQPDTSSICMAEYLVLVACMIP